MWICCTWPQNKREGKFISVLKKSAKRTMNFEELDAFQWTSLAETKRQQRKKKKKEVPAAAYHADLRFASQWKRHLHEARLFLFLCSPCVSMRYQMWTTSSLSLLAATIPSHRWNSVNFLSTGLKREEEKRLWVLFGSMIDIRAAGQRSSRVHIKSSEPLRQLTPAAADRPARILASDKYK